MSVFIPGNKLRPKLFFISAGRVETSSRGQEEGVSPWETRRECVLANRRCSDQRLAGRAMAQWSAVITPRASAPTWSTHKVFPSEEPRGRGVPDGLRRARRSQRVPAPLSLRARPSGCWVGVQPVPRVSGQLQDHPSPPWGATGSTCPSWGPLSPSPSLLR